MKKSKRLNLEFKIPAMQSGFTLIEMYIYMVILAVFLLVMTDLLVGVLNAQLESQAVSSVEQDGRFILARLSYDINRTNAIVDPGGLGSSSAGLVLDIEGDTYSYSLEGNDLILTSTLGSGKLNSSESLISDLNFETIGNIGGRETVRLNFKVSSKARQSSGQEERTFQTTIGRRW